MTEGPLTYLKRIFNSEILQEALNLPAFRLKKKKTISTGPSNHNTARFIVFAYVNFYNYDLL